MSSCITCLRHIGVYTPVYLKVRTSRMQEYIRSKRVDKYKNTILMLLWSLQATGGHRGIQQRAPMKKAYHGTSEVSIGTAAVTVLHVVKRERCLSAFTFDIFR